MRNHFLRIIGALFVAGALSGGIYHVTQGGGGGAGSGTANVWVDTSGGTCTRSVTAGAYVDADACGSIPDAIAAATKGDTIRVRAGSYAAEQDFVYDSGKGDTGPVTTILTDNGEVDLDGGMHFGDPNYDEGPTYLTFDGGSSKDFVVGREAAPAELGLYLSDHIVLNHFQVGHLMALNGCSGGGGISGCESLPNKTMYINESSNLTIENSIIGPGCCGGQGAQGGTPWPLYMPVCNEAPNCTLGTNPFSGITNHYNFTFDHNTVYGNSRDCGAFDSTYGSMFSTSCAAIGALDCLDVDLCHGDCIHTFGLTNFTITNNIFFGCDVQGIFVEPQFGGSMEGGSIVNNYFSEFQNDVAPAGATNWPSGQEGVGSHTIWTGLGPSGTTGTVTIAFNTLAGQNATDLGTTNGPSGSYGDEVVHFYGNLGGRITNDTGDCSTGTVTTDYDYNIFETPTSGDVCGTHEADYAESTLNSWFDQTTGALTAGNPPDGYVSDSTICALDGRSSPCDAGAAGSIGAG